jgi:hypothetical protein
VIEGTRPAELASVRALEERELAEWRIGRGERVVERRGRFWRMSRPGFWEPVHWLAGLRRDEAVRPAAGVGFRAVLTDEDVSAANGAMPVHVLEPLEGWGPERYRKSSQHRLRKAARLAAETSAPLSSTILADGVELVEVMSPEALERDGYGVLFSSVARTGVGEVPPRDVYAASLRREGIGERVTVLGGVQDGRLVAYLTGWVAGTTAYSQHLQIHSDALSTQVGTALVFAFVEACRRDGAIERVVNGLHSLEDESLSGYKEGIGFPVRRFPEVVRFLPGLAPLLRRFRPYVAYRLTGRTP